MTGTPGSPCRRCRSGRRLFFCCLVMHDFVWGAVIRRNFKLTESLNAHQENRQRKKSQIVEIRKPKHGLSSLQSPFRSTGQIDPALLVLRNQKHGSAKGTEDGNGACRVKTKREKTFRASTQKSDSVKNDKIWQFSGFSNPLAGYWSGGVPGLFLQCLA